jgi:glycine cleavage system H lipoate-binding protein
MPINMPQVGQDIAKARIVEWTKRLGDTVQKGEVIAVVESDKATFDAKGSPIRGSGQDTKFPPRPINRTLSSNRA